MLRRWLCRIQNWLTAKHGDFSVEYLNELDRREDRRGIDGPCFAWPIQKRIPKKRKKPIVKHPAVIYDLAAQRRKRQA